MRAIDLTLAIARRALFVGLIALTLQECSGAIAITDAIATTSTDLARVTEEEP